MRRSEMLVLAAASTACALVSSCSSSELREPEGTHGERTPGAPEVMISGTGETPRVTVAPGREDENSSVIDFGVSDEPTNEVEVVCAAQSAASELRSVYLAFAFDVSASMGGNNATRYSTKWLPVVAASEAFFAETDAAAISASVTFFPDADQDARCTSAAYLVPDVPLSPLPSRAFSTAIAGLGYSLGSNTWRSSTPTLAAFNGTVASLSAIADTSASTVRAVVMVTDGVPQGCDGSDDVQLVADAVRSSGVQTFVIGVANPPGDNAGDNLANLNVIAAAGGTDEAFIVGTGDPAQTQADFKAVIDTIRGVALSCNVAIPLPPTGTAFVPEKVNVTYSSSGGADVQLSYDAACVGPNTWHYDDANNPTTIVLCADACDQAQRDTSARLNIEFGCERRGTPR